jgi:hypothetical protein
MPAPSAVRLNTDGAALGVQLIIAGALLTTHGAGQSMTSHYARQALTEP